MTISGEDVKVPLDVPPASQDRYVTNYLKATQNSGRLMLGCNSSQSYTFSRWATLCTWEACLTRRCSRKLRKWCTRRTNMAC